MKPAAWIMAVTTTMASNVASAEPLSEVALYHRCFVRLTGEFPDYVFDTGLERIRAGESRAIDECMAAFDRASLQSQGSSATVAAEDETGRAVLMHLHALHGSWFLNRTFPEFDDISIGVRSLYDPSEPAAYVTRALFDPGVPAASIWTSTEHLRVAREPFEGETLFGLGPNDFVFDKAPVLQIGAAIGVEAPGVMTRTLLYEDEEEEEFVSTTLGLGAHYGGGFLGSTPYLLMNVNEVLEFAANGGRRMPRKWAKSVLHDALCRELPAVRLEDAIPFVVADSSVPFRRQARCSQCHVTIDRMASTIRGFQYLVAYGEEEDEEQGGFFPVFAPIESPAEAGWPAVEDPEYLHRPPGGQLYFRDHSGQLVNLPLDGPAALGAQLAELDDPYICLAKRYYRYFTGIDAFIGDPVDFPAAEGSPDVYHRQRVIALGRDLRSSGDLRQLIEAILRSPDYRESDFGAQP